MSKPPSSDDLEGHDSARIAGDDEGLLSLFGMHGQRPVGEAITIGLVDQIDHSAYDVDVPDRKWGSHGDLHIESWWTADLHDQSGVAMHPPRTKCVSGSLEHVVAAVELAHPPIPPVPGRRRVHHRHPDRRVRERHPELLRRGATAVITAEELATADRELVAGYQRQPPDPALVQSARRLAARTAPAW